MGKGDSGGRCWCKRLPGGRRWGCYPSQRVIRRRSQAIQHGPLPIWGIILVQLLLSTGYTPRTLRTPPETIDPYRLHFAHFGSGDGLATDLLLLNPLSEVAAEASVEVFSPDGILRFPLRRVAAPAAGMVEWTLPVGEELETGSIVVVTSRTRLSGILRFRYSDGGATAVSATLLGGGFVVPLSSRSDRTGVAIRNVDTEPVTVALSLGSLPKANRTIPGQGQIAAFVDEYFPGREKQELRAPYWCRQNHPRV